MAASIPVEVQEITASWLQDVMRAHVPDASLRGIDVVEAHSGTTGRARVVLTHDDPRLPASVFVKLAPFDVGQRAFVEQQGMGRAEARFYAEISGEIPVRLPRAWYAAHDDAGRYVMVLEDLVSVGATYPTQCEVDRSFVEGTIDAMAALHARFWATPRFSRDRDLAWVERRSRGYGSAAPLVSFALEQLGADLPEGSRRLGAVCVERADGVAAFLARGTSTLVHGDAHLGNMFVDDGKPGFLDWAMVSCAPGLRDVAYFLCASVPTDVRRAGERGFIARYCDRLREGGVALDIDVAWDQYREQLVTGWIAAAVTAAMGSHWQPIEVGRAATARADAAIADHDIADLLRARLR
jgi:aminoglycoside phosphotransferase (APT) family kinase protein